MFIFLNSIY